MIKHFFRTQNMTEIFLGFYVIVGLLLLIIASKIEFFDSFGKVAENKIPIIASIILAIMSGIVTYIIRYLLFKLDQPIIKNPNEFTKENFMGIAHASTLTILGLFILIIPPISINFLYVLILSVFMILISLNTYFIRFWLKRFQGDDSFISIDALKLEHLEWSHIFNNVCLALLLITGIFITYYSTPNVSSLLTSNTDIYHILMNYINIILIVYVTFMTPIIWLLRPIHITMETIRNEITKMNSHK